jgi:hypothetical protein
MCGVYSIAAPLVDHLQKLATVGPSPNEHEQVAYIAVDVPVVADGSL